MRRMLGLFLALTVAGLTRAADAPHHNKLTPQEIAGGWILLFDGETTFGWQSPNGSKWTLVNGMLAPQSDKHGVLVTTTAFADFDLLVQYRARNNSKVAVFVGCDAAATGAEKVRSGKDRKSDDFGKEPVEKGPSQSELISYGEQWMEARIEVRGSQVVNNNYYPADSNRRFAQATKSRSPEKE